MGTSAEYKVRLHSVEWTDLLLVFAWRSDREIMQYLPSAPEQPTWKQHLAYWNKSGHRDWMIMYQIDKQDEGGERPIGVVHIISHTGEVGVIIGEKSLWGQGIAAKALALMLALVKQNQLTQAPIWAAIHPENTGSQKAFTKVGFVNTHKLGRNGQEKWVLK